MSEIRFSEAGKRKHEVKVAKSLDQQMGEGEFKALVGLSGREKSTTLLMIAGIESISSGDLFIGGRRANEQTSAEHNVSMDFRSRAIFPNMSVRKNMSFGSRLRKPDPSILQARSRIAEMPGFGELPDRKPHQLSGGQAQRAALRRAMIRKPDAFLFD